jgi:hypothetical protein
MNGEKALLNTVAFWELLSGLYLLFFSPTYGVYSEPSPLPAYSVMYALTAVLIGGGLVVWVDAAKSGRAKTATLLITFALVVLVALFFGSTIVQIDSWRFG